MTSSNLSLLFLAVSIVTSLLVAAIPFIKPVKWHDEVGPITWKVMGGLAFLAAVAAPVFIYWQIDDPQDPWRNLATTMSFGLLSVVVAYSWTDIRVRKVDRRVLSYPAWITLLTSAIYTLKNFDLITAVTAGVMILLGMIVYTFAIKMIGASDARALILIGTAIIPVVGWSGFYVSMFLVCFVFILLGAAMMMYKKRVNPTVSFPAVPMLLIPFWLVLMSAPASGYQPGVVSVTTENIQIDSNSPSPLM